MKKDSNLVPMVFRPTMEEFSDFSGYIRHIESLGGHRAGICKIIPPDEWVPRKQGYDPEGFTFKIDRPLKQHFNCTNSTRGGVYQTKCSNRQPMSIKEFHKMATSHPFKPPKFVDYDDLERKYWRNLRYVDPIYGCDVAESITDPEVKEFNIANLDTILKYSREDSGGKIVHGVNSPYLYFGMWKATFSWHVEDMDLYGINFLHHGAPKTWYCVPPHYGYMLENCARQLFPQIASCCSNFMRHKTCLISPTVLEEFGIPYNKMVQEERHIIIVFPYAYHSGFNHGFNIAESTNFGTERWIEYGKRHRPCDCSKVRVKLDMGTFVKRFQSHLYQAWLDGKDIAPHPEDPADVADQIWERAKNPEAYAKKLENKISSSKKQLEELSSGKKVWERTKSTNNSNNKKVVMIDTYQHVEMSQIKVRVYRNTKKCLGSSLNSLKEFLDKPDLDGIQELIAKGEMIKISEEEKKTEGKSKSMLSLPVYADVYRHKDDGQEVYLDPFEPHTFLKTPPKYLGNLSKSELKDMIDSDRLVFNREAVIRVKREKTFFTNRCSEMYRDVSTGKVVRVTLIKKKLLGVKGCPSVRREIAEGKYTFVKTVARKNKKKAKPFRKLCKVYFNLDNEETIFISMEGSVIGDLSPEMSILLSTHSIKDLVEKQMLVHVGEKVVKIEEGDDILDVAVFVKYSIEDEPIGTFDMAFLPNRAIYRFTKKDCQPVQEVFTRNSLTDLEQEGLLREMSGPVKEEEVMQQMLKQKMRFRWFLRYEIKESGEHVLVSEIPAKSLAVHTRSKHIDKFGQKTVEELEQDGVLVNPVPLCKLTNEDFFLKTLAGAGTKKSEEEFEITPLPHLSSTVFYNTKSRQCWVLKEENLTDNFEKRFQSLQKEKNKVTNEVPSASVRRGQKRRREELESTKNNDDDSIRVNKRRRDGLRKRNDEPPNDKETFVSESSENKNEQLKNGRKRVQSRIQDVKIENDCEDEKGIETLEPLEQTKTSKNVCISTQTTDLLKFMLEKVKNSSGGTGKIKFDEKEIIDKGVANQDTLRLFVPILKGLEIIKRNGNSLRWCSYSYETLESTLFSILNSRDEFQGSKAEEDIWKLCSYILRVMMSTLPGEEVPCAQIQWKLTKDVESDTDLRMLYNSIIVICDTLEGLKLIKRVDMIPRCYIYNGPNVFESWLSQQTLVQGQVLKLPIVNIERMKEERLLKQMKLLKDNVHVGSFTTYKANIIKTVVSNGKIGKRLTKEQRRSIDNMDKFCECGKSKRKRSRCKTCQGCRAENCKLCLNCLEPQRKQSCVMRVCLFPILPDCPCFLKRRL